MRAEVDGSAGGGLIALGTDEDPCGFCSWWLGEAETLTVDEARESPPGGLSFFLSPAFFFLVIAAVHGSFDPILLPLGALCILDNFDTSRMFNDGGKKNSVEGS